MEDDIVNRFWNKVVKMGDTKCWEWTASLRGGYGRFAIGKGKWTTAHRFSYELKYGKVPEGMLVCHTCDNRKCVNPKHLFLGNHEDNAKDMVKKNRQAKGINHSKNKLTEVQVIEIRQNLASKTPLSHTQLAERYNVAKQTITKISQNKIWKHIDAY